MPHGLSVFCRSWLLSLIVSVTLPPPHLLLRLHCLMSDHPTACSFFQLLLGRRSLLPILCGGAQHSVVGSCLGPVNTPPGDLSLPFLRVSSTPSPLVQMPPGCLHSPVWRTVQFSGSVVSESLPPHGLQYTRPPCPSPTPGVYSNSCPSSR